MELTPDGQNKEVKKKTYIQVNSKINRQVDRKIDPEKANKYSHKDAHSNIHTNHNNIDITGDLANQMNTQDR